MPPKKEEVFSALVDKLTNIDATYTSDTYLMYACLHGYYTAAIKLIDRGANVDLQNEAGDTALIQLLDAECLIK